MDNNKKRTLTAVSIEAHKRLLDYSRENGVSATVIVSKAIMEYILLLEKGYSSGEELAASLERANAAIKRRY